MGRAANILVIDDEQGIRDLLAGELRELGHQVETAASGSQAVEAVGHQRYQLAICDINLPGLDGFQVMEKIKSQNPETEVIMITGQATIERAVEAMRCGAYDFVQKPFSLGEILALVEKSLEKGHMRNFIQELQEAKRQLENAQQQLIQSEKMASLGQMAAGVAHELNNPLSGILGFTQLLLEEKTLLPQQRQDLETIQEQARRCREIIQGLLQFSRRRDPHKEAIDLMPLLRSALQLIRYDLSTSGIQVVEEWPASLPLVLADAHQIQQVFINLVTNARHAVEGRPQPRLALRAGHRDGWVWFSIEDNGVGIPPEIRNKIFDPFFTTKPPGKGTGLGLAICHGIVEEHRGRLRVESRVNESSTFTLEIPIHNPTSGAVPKAA